MPAPTLPRFAVADTDYIGKLNSGADLTETALEELFSRTDAWDANGPARTFVALTDTPSSYAGAAGKVLVVNATADGVAFAAAGPPSAFTGLSDAPGTIDALQFVRGNAGGTSLEMVAIEPGMLDWMPSFVGQANKLLAINATEDAIEASDTVSPSAFKGLTDVDVPSFSGATGATIIVNEAANKLVLGPVIPVASVQLVDMPPDLDGHAGHVPRVKSDESGYELVPGAGGGATAFVDLTDGPGPYEGQQYRVPMVNPAENRLIWSDLPPPSVFLGLDDVWEVAATETRLTSYAGHGGKVFLIADNGLGLELSEAAFEAQVDGLISGGAIVWLQDLDYFVSSARYAIGGAIYATAGTALTLAAADPTYDRIDAVLADVNSAVYVRQGTPAGSPREPSYDTEVEVLLGYITVAAASTAPEGVVNEMIFDEGTEWTPYQFDSESTTPTGTLALASTSSPYAGSVCIEGTMVHGRFFRFTKAATFDILGYRHLVFRIKNKGTQIGTTPFLRIIWRLSAEGGDLDYAIARGDGIRLAHGDYGLDLTNTTSYQLIVIPITDFGIREGIDADRLRFYAHGTDCGFFVDTIWLQTAASSTSLDRSPHTVYAGPATGGNPDTPTWRRLVYADLPDLSGHYLTEETADALYEPIGGGSGVYQPLDADLTALAALTATGGWVKRTAANTYSISTPTASDVGADATGTAASAVSAHEGASDPHPQYLTQTEGDARYLQSGSQPYVMAFYIPGSPTSSQICGIHVATEAVTIPAGLTGSKGTGETGATAQTDFDVQKNGISVGTVRFSASATTASFIAASSISLAAGDKLKIIAPATPDATLADIAISIRGTR